MPVPVRPFALLIGISLSSGCQGVALNGLGGALRFSPAPPNTVALIGSNQTSAKPMAAPAPMAGAPVASAAMMPVFYGGGYWGPEYELVATTEARTVGFKGTLTQVLAAVVSPIVQAWAPDAVLRNVSGTTDSAGANLTVSLPTAMPAVVPVAIRTTAPMATKGLDSPNPSAVPTPEPTATPGNPATEPGAIVESNPVSVGFTTGWRLEFVSASRSETLLFMIGSDQTMVVKQTYKQRPQVDLSKATVGSAEAVALVAKAIQDKTVTASDPATGYGGGPGYAIAVPAVAVAAGPTAAIAPMPQPAPDGTELTTLPLHPRWDISLGQEQVTIGNAPVSRLVWSVSVNPGDGVTYPEGTFVIGGYARVDAASGQLLSLSRPRRMESGAVAGSPPVPMPAVTPIASPRP